MPAVQGYSWSLAAGVEWQLLSANPCVTKQPYSGATLLTPTGEGPRKGCLKIAHSEHPGQGTAPVGTFHPAVEINKGK